MEKPPDGDGNGSGSEPLTYKTWMLRVSIHCGGCLKKVKKVIQSIEGVYKIEIDSKQHKVVVTGNVESGTLIKKLIRSGKNAELWTEKDAGAAAAGDNGERRNDQGDSQAKDNSGDSSGEDHADEKGLPQAVAAPGGGGSGGGGKKKKKKKKKKGNAGPSIAGGAAAGSGPPPPAAPVDQKNGHPTRQQCYYPAPEYGMNHDAAASTTGMAASHYRSPLQYSYIHSSLDCYPTPLPSDAVLDVHGYYDDETGCTIT